MTTYITIRYMVFFFFISVGLLLLFCVTPNVYAAPTKLGISYEPDNPNITSGQQSVVTAALRPAKGSIAAVTLVFQSTGGVKIVKILDAIDNENTPFTNTKTIIEDADNNSVKVTVLFMKTSADLPAIVKVPVVITGTKSGNLQISTKESEIIDDKGMSYILSQPKASYSYITFSQNGKNTILPPTPTPLSANTVAVNVAMKFQGIKPADVKTKTITGVKVQFAQSNDNTTQYSLPQFISVSMDDTGVWRGTAIFPNIRPGKNYMLLIKGPKHLQKRICENNATEIKAGSYRCPEGNIEIRGNTVDINAAGVLEMTGDVGIQDGILNSYDLSFVQNILQKTANNTSSDADLNYDGKVDNTDYNLLTYTLTNTGGQDQQ